jgi:uncharacterized protein YecE (DUF72 family)
MEEQQDLFSEILPSKEPRHVERLRAVQEGVPSRLFLGTTSWSNEDWEGLIYPEGCAASDYIEHYAKVFKSVEIDSTWYRIPSAKAVEGWLRRTPEHFRFAAKVPRIISHEKGMVDCLGEMEEFLATMEPMGSRLGPLVMQFPYVARGQDALENERGADFMARLERFLPQLPTREFQFAIEVRNGRWVGEELLDILRYHNAALVLNSYYTMPALGEVCRRVNPLTADFLYVRFLGDRKRMDEHVEGLIQSGDKKRHWDQLVWERGAEIVDWARGLQELVGADPEREVYAFFNNHYAGYAPGSLGQFAKAWKDGA